MKILKSGVFSVPYVTGQAIDWISPSVNSFIQWLNMHWELGTEPGGGGKKDNMTSVCSGALKVLWVPGVAFLLNREVSPEFPQMWDSQFLNQRRQWHPTPVLLPGKSHGRRSLVGCSPWSRWVRHGWATSLSLCTFMHWRRQWHPMPVFLPGESQGQGSLVGCHLWGRTESDTTDVT